MPRISAGLLMYRRRSSRLEVLLVHPGGPYWARKDRGVWSIPKGGVDDDEELLDAARREFEEETGVVPRGPFQVLGTFKTRGGKTVYIWAFEGDCDISKCRSSTFEMEWPPHSGKRVTYPEVDRAEFFDLDEARRKINAQQRPLLDSLQGRLPD
ncbi:MAG: NUDIX domain-containing protein [Phycisphaeraceae bacterium]